ncbi:hypothetical protein ElyMa_001221800 [Elysia marginata]|uniref:Uncharacterized protein n=1 Tax=Elysia marginata TaxID=1093978 RepID=A0AAV4I9Y8_9GAST|nr:hypothetical protein ElyMa_001221800 [Elysia marginata]
MLRSQRRSQELGWHRRFSLRWLSPCCGSRSRPDGVRRGVGKNKDRSLDPGGHKVARDYSSNVDSAPRLLIDSDQQPVATEA